MTLGPRVLEAYRRDCAALRYPKGGPFGPSDGRWLQIATLLEHAARLPDQARRELLAEVSLELRGVLDEKSWSRGPRLDPRSPSDPDSAYARIRLLAERMEDAEAHESADALLDAYTEAYRPLDPLEAGRVLAVRARIAWKTGDHAMALARYDKVARAGRANDLAELCVRADLGRAVVARLTGNYPRSTLLASRGLKAAAKADLARLSAVGRHILMVNAAKRRDFAVAIEHGWEGYLEARGDELLEAELLGNMGQLLLDAGDPVSAIAALRTTLDKQPPARVRIPALGALVQALLSIGDKRLADVTASRALEASGKQPYDLATLHVDLAEAYLRTGQREVGIQHKARALEIARAYGYHELTHLADTLQPSEEQELSVPMPERVASVVAAIRQLAHVT